MRPSATYKGFGCPQQDAGGRVVAVEKIIGSLGERWMRVDQAFHLGVELSPVMLHTDYLEVVATGR